ncbi:CDC42 small effector protein 2-like [Patiria miniata]|uniref:CRIB domain-containing protein n=1 Tax=Patiria miniata TaxID=46514 RepID=A0A914A3E1_PATMI|nr:CDC42 small effector protein 2-like [Patiria miniata]XP_038058110.1 CDC42 small effector protein 2-like [Patiria miniata]
MPPRRMSDVLICFGCCVTEQPPPTRRRIDRTMIGLPTNFIHTGHIGSGDMTPQQELNEQNNHLNSIQVQMQSKGGYSGSPVVEFQRNVIDVRKVPANDN